MSDTGKSGRLAGVYGARDSRQTAELYDEWAAEYERDLLGYGYVTPAVIAGLLGRYVVMEAGSLLDAGVGTGMVGEVLGPLGCADLSGIDLSENMLNLARKKDAYRDLRQMELGERLNFPDNNFAAAVAAVTAVAAGSRPASLFRRAVTGNRHGWTHNIQSPVRLCRGHRVWREAARARRRWPVAIGRGYETLPAVTARGPRTQSPVLRIPGLLTNPWPGAVRPGHSG